MPTPKLKSAATSPQNSKVIVHRKKPATVRRAYLRSRARGDVPPLLHPAARSPGVNLSTQTRSRWSSPWSYPPRRRMPASTRRRVRSSRSPTRPKRCWRSARNGCGITSRRSASIATRPRTSSLSRRSWSTKFGGVVPQTRDELVTLAGVGRKTANVVLSMAFGQATMAVDTHIFRIANRLKPGAG